MASHSRRDERARATSPEIRPSSGAAAGAFTTLPRAFFREAGSGPAVVCIHANASSSGQWQPLMDLLASQYRILAPDCYGAGKSPEWPSAEAISLPDEVQLIEPALANVGPLLTLVGHSYGGAVALKLALARPWRVRALALYEPALFHLTDATRPPPNEADGIRDTIREAGAALDFGDRGEAARIFIDYWSGTGAWAGMPQNRRDAILQVIHNVRRWGHALFSEDVPLHVLANLDIPVLLMTGSQSTASAHSVVRILAQTLPRAELVEFPELGHMGPVTHPAEVNEAISRFLARHHQNLLEAA